MALRLRTNGAPLSGALFVSNPRRRKRKATKRRRKAATTRRRTTTRRRKKRNTASAKRRTARHSRLLASRRNRAASLKRARAARKAAATRRRNAMKRTLAAKKAAATRRRNAAAKRRRRNGTKKGMVRKTARRAYMKTNRSRRRTRRNPMVRRYTKRRNSAIQSFQDKALAPVKRLLGNLPVVGTALSKYVGPLAFGAAAGVVHYYGVKAIQRYAPRYAQAIAPVQFTVAGSFVAGLLLMGGKIPGLKKVSADTRNKVATAALIVGGGLDTYRALSKSMGDLGAEVPLYNYSGLGVDLSGIGVDLGDGGAYDVVPLPQNMDYSGASMSDAMMAPADLSVEEGNAALAGPASWHAQFGPAPIVHTRHGAYSPFAGRRGHRFGWLIKLIGFGKFQRLAALPPVQRTAYIAELKQQAIALADAKIAGGNMGSIGLDIGATMTAGAVI